MCAGIVERTKAPKSRALRSEAWPKEPWARSPLPGDPPGFKEVLDALQRPPQRNLTQERRRTRVKRKGAASRV